MQRDSGQIWFKRGLLTVGIFTAVVMVFYPYLARKVLRPALEKERATLPVQTGSAVIAVYVPARDEVSTGRQFPARIMVRFQGQLLEPRDVQEAGNMALGKTVQITYRVGSGGHIYIDTARPLPVKSSP